MQHCLKQCSDSRVSLGTKLATNYQHGILSLSTWNLLRSEKQLLNDQYLCNKDKTGDSSSTYCE